MIEPRPRSRPVVFEAKAKGSDVQGRGRGFTAKPRKVTIEQELKQSYFSFHDQSARQKNIFYVWMNDINAISGLGLDGLSRYEERRMIVEIQVLNINNCDNNTDLLFESSVYLEKCTLQQSTLKSYKNTCISVSRKWPLRFRKKTRLLSRFFAAA